MIVSDLNIGETGQAANVDQIVHIAHAHLQHGNKVLPTGLASSPRRSSNLIAAARFSGRW